MEWEKPSYIEINMNSEIGGYQDDEFQERGPLTSDALEPPKLRLSREKDGSGCETMSQPLAGQ